MILIVVARSMGFQLWGHTKVPFGFLNIELELQLLGRGFNTFLDACINEFQVLFGGIYSLHTVTCKILGGADGVT
jgi:hypothetical protein